MSRVKYFFSLICTLVLVSACSEIKDELEIFKDDVDFDATERNVDIERDNAERIALGLLESVYLPHQYLPLYDVLDASDFAAVGCVSGDVTLEATKSAGEDHNAGDRVIIDYDRCLQAGGQEYDGKLTLTYGAIRGLNRTFQKVDAAACFSAIEREYSSSFEIVENTDDQGRYFWSDAVRFRKVGSYLEVDFLVLVPVDEGDDLVYEARRTVELPANAIVMNRALDIDSVNSTPDNTLYVPNSGYPSLTGGAVYSIIGDEFTEELCQQYDRTLVASFDSFTSRFVGDGDSEVAITGTASLLEGTSDFDGFKESILDSSFDIQYVNANRLSNYELQGATIERVRSLSQRAYQYTFSGLLASSEIGGAVDFSTNSTISGDALSPETGGYIAFGRGSERLNVGLRGPLVQITAATLGDTNGDGNPDLDESISTFWQDLLNRDFVVPSSEE